MLPTESCAEDLSELRDAIIELYLAIKIRSTEEVSNLSLLFRTAKNGVKPDYLTLLPVL